MSEYKKRYWKTNSKTGRCPKCKNFALIKVTGQTELTSRLVCSLCGHDYYTLERIGDKSE